MVHATIVHVREALLLQTFHIILDRDLACEGILVSGSTRDEDLIVVVVDR